MCDGMDEASGSLAVTADGTAPPQHVVGESELPKMTLPTASTSVMSLHHAAAGLTAIGAPHDTRIDEYQQVGSQFRALTDIRFKLIGFLPAGTIATVLVAKGSGLVNEPPIAIFGLLVTLCLATYNKRNDQLYDELVSRAAELERGLGLNHGSFSQRPTPWLSFGPWRIEHGLPVGFIYAASAALWTYVLVNGVAPDLVVPWRGIDFGPVWPWGAAVGVLLAWRLMCAWERRSSDAAEAAIIGLKSPFGDETCSELVKRMQDDEKIVALFRRPDKAAKKIESRLMRQQVALQAARKAGPDYAALSDILANVVDLPARWIHDVWTGRR